jgi:SAM-dependent methyltransferase
VLWNKTLAFEDLRDPAIAPTTRALRRWVVTWLLRGHRLGVNGNAKRRLWVRNQKMWEYARALALTGTSGPVRGAAGPFGVLDVGGAMTLPVFYLAEQGDRVTSLDISERLVAETSATARRRGLAVDARVLNLVEEDPSAADLGVPGGFDRVYCLCVIEHILPPGQGKVAARMAKLLKPGGLLALTFDYGENARSEAPLRTRADVDDLIAAVGLPLHGNERFEDDGRRYSISRRFPEQPFTFGSLFFRKPD